MKKILLLMGAVLFISGTAFGQTQIAIEDFEDGTVIYTTSITEFTDGGGDFFQRTTSPTESFTNIQGSGIFEAMDIDGEGASLPVTMTFDDINISGFTSLELRVYLAEGDDGANQDWDASDYVHFDFDMDNTGSFTNLLHIESSGGTNTEPAIDTNFDGTGNGTSITNTFTQYTQSISGTGSNLDIRVTFNLNSGDEDIAIDNIEIYGTASGGTPTKLAVTEINGGSSPSNGTEFDVKVELQDSDSDAIVASQDTSVTLSLGSGSGALGGTLTGTISSGSANVTISGITYNTTESGVTITATNTGGSLTAGTSSSFEVLGAPTKLVLNNFPSDGYSGVSIDEFTVQVQRSDNSVDLNSTASIAIAKTTGSGAITATSPVAAVNGVATFSDVSFDAADDYTVTVSSTGLTSATSGSLSIISVNSSPTIGDVFITEYSDASAFSNEFVEFYNASSDAVDLDGYVVRQQNSTQTYTFSGSTIVESNGFLILGRNSDESSFESEWGTLPSNVTYVNSSNNLPSINGSEIFLLENGSGTNVDPATDDEYSALAVSSSGKVYRGYLNGNASSDWVSGSRSDATPGVLDAAVSISGTAGWRLLTIPKTGATPADISDDGIGAQFTSDTDSATIYTYDDTGSFEAIPSDATSLTDGNGLAVYFFNNTNAGSSALPLTLDASGAEPSSDVVVNLYSGATGRYTLVGNPFATNVDLANVSANIAISSNMTFWDNTAGSYTTESISGGLVIQPWQGYWVQTASSTGSAQLTFGTSDKTSSDSDTTHFDKANPNTVKELRFTVESNYNTEKNLTLQVANDASEGWDSYDLIKLGSLLPQNVSAAFIGELDGESVLKGIEAIPSSLDKEITIPVVIDLTGETQILSMSWEGLSELPNSWSIMLHDYETEVSFDLRSTNTYDFEVIVGSSNEKINPVTVLRSSLGQKMNLKSNQTARFGITITPAANTVNNEPGSEVQTFALDQNYPNPFNPSTTINYSVENSGLVTLSVYNLMGQKVAELVNGTKSAGSYNVSWNASGAASGMYYYRLEAGGQTMTRKMTLIK